jgi:hypothetical protein
VDTDDPAAALTAFQIEVAGVFFSLPSAQGFVLTGGAALVAQQLSARPTQDLDFLTSRGGDVPVARDEFESAATARGWTVTRIRDEPQFCRLQVHGADDLLVDLLVDAPPNQPSVASVLGPTLGLEDLAGRKLLALFDRAAARDFADVYVLAQRYGRDLLLDRAAAVDLGFDRGQLAGMMAMLDRYTDEDLPVPEGQVPALRGYFRDWRSVLTASSNDLGKRRPAT